MLKPKNSFKIEYINVECVMCNGSAQEWINNDMTLPI